MAGEEEVERGREAAEHERHVVEDEPTRPREPPPEDEVRKQMRRHDEELGPGDPG